MKQKRLEVKSTDISCSECLLIYQCFPTSDFVLFGCLYPSAGAFLASFMNQQGKESSMVKVSLKDIYRHDTIIILCPPTSAYRQSEI